MINKEDVIPLFQDADNNKVLAMVEVLIDVVNHELYLLQDKINTLENKIQAQNSKDW